MGVGLALGLDVGGPVIRADAMSSTWFSFFLAAFLPAIQAAATIDSLAPDWQALDRRRLRIANAAASSSLGEQYAPDRICDGDRHTKWVSPTCPSASAPQWIALTLAAGPQSVNGVAVFGERVDNDGILDADVQVEAGGEFKTVASVRDARSSAWLATFEAVTTTKVRLLILRSGGPTDHTDVWETEVYGRTLSEAELRSHLAASLDRLEHALVTASNLLHNVAPGSANLSRSLRAAWDRVAGAREGLARGRSDWNSQDREALVRTLSQAEDTETLAARLAERLQHGLAAKTERAAAIARLQSDGRAFLTPGALVVRVEPDRATLANREVALWLAGRTGRWNAVWRDGVDAVIAGAELAVEVNGVNLAAAPTAPVAQTFRDPLGSGEALVQTWHTNGITVEREFRAYAAGGVLTVGGRIRNEGASEVRLGTIQLLHLGDSGGWRVGSSWEAPAAVYVQGHSLIRSTPFAPAEASRSGMVRDYRSSGVLALIGREPDTALIIGCVRADEAAPDLAATFRLDEGGSALSASSRFLARVLGPGESLEFNRVYLAAAPDPFRALESYGEALARFSAVPVRTGPTSLWCSWYAHRMGMTEEKVLANAEVAARHFRPLGLEIMQLDHGWQRGDITGDWVPNERFPHGLRWLADQLRERHGLRLGVWIAPTDVAETSKLYQEHADWMLKGPDGKPRVNWRWYWKPNPDCYELDATHPEAYRYIADTFRRLTGEGVSYYKIDFIAAAGGEHFVPRDPKATRGWSALHRAMQAIREGAGDAAWIRYCQTPPVLSAGLAHSAYGGDDTLDAGIPGRFDVLRDNAHALAAGWWLNDRPYHREVCDMSVRMQGSVEEVRVRAALMTLANCSVSWSDELCYLPPSRIRLMQQCLPPGNPPMRPLDLCERDVPSVWHLKLTNAIEAWDVVGLFNFDRDAAVRGIRFEELGLDPQAEYAVFEFWEERFHGVRRGGIELTLPGESSRILSIRRVTGVPQLIGTDLHVLQGWHEVKRLAWDSQARVLSGVYQRMPGIRGRAFFLVPAGYQPKFDFPLSPGSARLTHVEGPIWMQELEFAEREVTWSVPFDAVQPPQ